MEMLALLTLSFMPLIEGICNDNMMLTPYSSLAQKFLTADTNQPKTNHAELIILELIKAMDDTKVLICEDCESITNAQHEFPENIVLYNKLEDLYELKEFEPHKKVNFIAFIKKFTNSTLDILSIGATEARKMFFIMTRSEEIAIQTIKNSNYYQVFVASPHNGGYKLLQKCVYCDKGQSSMEQINFWDAMKGFRKPLTFQSSFRGTFNGASLKIAHSSAKGPEYHAVDVFGTDIFIGTSGPEFDMLDVVAGMLRFKYILFRPVEGSNGAFKNGRWNGKVGMVYEGNADIAIGMLSITYARFNVVRETAVINREESCLVSTKPLKTPRWTAVFNAFPPIIWFLTFLSAIATGITLYIVQILFTNGRNLTSFAKSISIPFQTLCTEPFVVNTPRLTTIIVLSGWMLGSVTLVGFYCGELTSLTLTPPYNEKPIDTAKDLIQSHRYWITN